MRLQVKGKNFDLSPSIREYAERKMARLGKFVADGAQVELELAVETNPSIAAKQVAEATLFAKGGTLRARESSTDMKASIDQLVDKLERQVQKQRQKKREGRRDGKPEPTSVDPFEL